MRWISGSPDLRSSLRAAARDCQRPALKMISETERYPPVIPRSSGILWVQIAVMLGLAEVRHSLINNGVTDLPRPHGRMCDIRPVPLIAPRDGIVRGRVGSTMAPCPVSANPQAVCRRKRSPEHRLAERRIRQGLSGPSADPSTAHPTPAPLTRERGRRVSGAEPSAHCFRLAGVVVDVPGHHVGTVTPATGSGRG